MTPSKLWTVMNDLQMVTSKICSAREILECAIEAHENHKHEKVERLMYAVDEYLQYYLSEFDDKFQLSWEETVVKEKKRVDDCMPPWGHSDIEAMKYTDEELEEMCNAAEEIGKEKLVRSWSIPVEEAYNKDGETIFSYIQFPDSLLEHMGIKEGSQIQWIVNPDSTVTIRKI